MSAVLEHVKHRVRNQTASDPRIWQTRCARSFADARYFPQRVDVHRPATSRCPECYP